VGRGKEAIQCFNDAFRIDPNDADAWHGRVYVLLALGNREGARLAYDQMLRLRPAGERRPEQWLACGEGGQMFAPGALPWVRRVEDTHPGPRD
jgi:tetratricopeptide (TPR) repeat protein